MAAVVSVVRSDWSKPDMTLNRLSSRERMLAAIRRQPADRVPFSPYVSNCSALWYGDELRWNDQVERARRMLELELDPTFDIWFPDPMPHPDVRIKTWRDRRENETTITKEYHTPAGVLRQVVREGEDWCTPRHGPWMPTTWGTEKRDHYGIDLFDDWNVSRRLEPWVKGPEDLDKLEYIIRPMTGYQLDEWAMDAARAMEHAARFDALTVARRLIVGDAFQWFCDIPWFMTTLHDDPDFVDRFLGIFQRWAMSLVNLALEVGVDVVQYRGWYESPTFWGPKLWNRFIVPYMQEHALTVHNAGKLYSYLNPEGHGVYADILTGMDLDIVQGIDPRTLQKGTMQDTFAKLGERSAFWGGVNAEVTLDSCDEAIIDAAVKEAIAVLGANNGLILSAFLFPEVPRQAIMRMIAAWRKYR
jgi:hypothetical protein